MSGEQLIVFGVLFAALVMFIWNRWRYDVVSLMALMVVALLGIVPPEEVFLGFGHPAVITVAAVLVLSRGLLNAGVVDVIARQLIRVGSQPILQVAALTSLVAVASAFMNNVGALALMMPVAIWMSRKSGQSPSILLMPLAFGSLLGGMCTLIGTPSNIIIASYRANTGEGPFGMFDFLPIGGAVTIVGVLFIGLVGWRLTPHRIKAQDPDELFKIADYISELKAPEGSKFVGRTLHSVLAVAKKDAEFNIVGLIRGEKRSLVPSTFEILRAGDILIVESDSESLKSLIDATGLELNGNLSDKEKNSYLGSGDVSVIEAIISPDSPMVRQSATSLDLRERYGINVLAVARQGQRVQQRLGKIRFAAGDILLLQAPEETLSDSLSRIGCLRLANRGLRIGHPPKILLSAGIFAAALALVALNILPAQLGLTCAALLMVLVGLVTPTDAYKSIDWPVIILLAAMIPIGEALETTGGAQLIADQLMAVARTSAPVVTVTILLVAAMLLSNVINNAAAAILMAPIAIGLARGIEVSADPFLMAVAIGSSCAFLTPIGHQSNAMVMTPGGYKFGDYWRVGLPLSILVVVTAVPLLMILWGD